MYILIEEEKYDLEVLNKLIPERFITELTNNKAKVSYVGYYNNFKISKMIIILPKIFIEGGLIFDNISPNELINNKLTDAFKKYDKTINELNYLHKFNLDIYLSLKKYKQRISDIISAKKEHTNSILSNIPNNYHSELDTIFSLINFYKENKNIFIFHKKQTLSNHKNKINWNRTISNGTPIIQDSYPIYLNISTTRKVIDYEEELLTIFYSLLNFFNKEYGFNIKLDPNYKTIKIKDPELFVKQSIKKIKKIKHKYFSDKLKKIYKLLLIYFEKKLVSSSKIGNSEYILSSNFNLVFEDMIDHLISDYKTTFLKNQSDGKVVDHLFKFNSLFCEDKIYYVGDSKYYKDTTSYSLNTIYKQHTYAKNLIQYNINIHNSDGNGEYLKSSQGVRYRDEITEGYNISPNFFIQGYINHKKIYDATFNFEQDNSNEKVNIHFNNRLFDRDTLIIHNFKINFNYVLKSYTSKNDLEEIKEIIYKRIKESILIYFSNEYNFYIVTPNIDFEDFLNKYFRILNGKIYRDSIMTNSLFLALSKNTNFNEENQNILNLIEQSANIELLDIIH
ncbi:hypothetical protein [Aliarcobacter butzleri]|uniref:hypothetical protein n=1 Tax=Aliarcobacter butzleri TaxID=28197 RepID=UPI0021B21330|nr:hypothetical protein [Aliarcobacter butzleri]MCT7615660.1 hypothetical protein [Aliarcobacter butzleri]